MNIKKNSIVKNLQPVPESQYRHDAGMIPAGSVGRVWRVNRKSGTCNVTFKDSKYNNTHVIPMNQLETVDNSSQNQVPKPGDIFYTSWGYEQTNIDFYQIISVKNKTATICKIGSDRKYTGPMCGECSPVKDKFVGEPFQKRIVYSVNGSPSMKIASYAYATPVLHENSFFFSEWH